MLIAGVNLFALGLILEALLGWPPQVAIPVAALVGMAAMFAGASHALLASIVFAFEATSILILVAMVGAVVLARREDQ